MHEHFKSCDLAKKKKKAFVVVSHLFVPALFFFSQTGKISQSSAREYLFFGCVFVVFRLGIQEYRISAHTDSLCGLYILYVRIGNSNSQQ